MSDPPIALLIFLLAVSSYSTQKRDFIIDK